jgi:mRNA interferase MazF
MTVFHLNRAGTVPDDSFRPRRHTGAPGRNLVGQFGSAQGSEIRKARPAIVVTANALNRARHTVVVVPLSTGPQPRPPIIVSTPSAGPNSVAVRDQVRAVDKRRLTRNEGQLSAADLRAIGDVRVASWNCEWGYGDRATLLLPNARRYFTQLWPHQQ